MCFACMSVSAPYACLVLEQIRKGLRSSLELELWMVLSKDKSFGDSTLPWEEQSQGGQKDNLKDPVLTLLCGSQD